MLTNELNRWITIEKAVNAKGSTGVPTDTYAVLFETWAGVSYGGGSFNSDNVGQNVRVDASFTLRWESSVNYKCRVVYEGQYYSIDHIEIIGRREGLRLKCLRYTQEV